MSHHDTETETAMLEPDHTDDLFDEEWLGNTPRRSRWRAALLLALGVAVTFFGGVEVQKHFGTSNSETAAFGGGFAPGAMPEGLPAMGGGAVPGSSTEASGEGQDGGSDETSVIGTLTKVKGSRWVVTDLGGTKHTITIDKETRLVEEKSLKEGDVPKGSDVTVTGDASDSDDLTATSITVR